MSPEDGGLIGYDLPEGWDADRSSLDTAARMALLWQIPARLRVPDRWHVPALPWISLGVASGNPEKIEAARRVFMWHGGKFFHAVPAPEEHILRLLTPRPDTTRAAEIISGAGAAEGIVRGIAAVKPTAAFLGNIRITHAFGQDTDIAILGQTDFTPVGKAESWSDLERKLLKLRGQYIKIISAAVLADMHLGRPVAAEIVTILLKLAEFDPDTYVRAMDITRPGATSGGIDLANPAIVPFLDEQVEARVNRMDVFSPQERHLQVIREVLVPPHLVPPMLGDIVRGVDEMQIATTIYNGLANPQAFPVVM